MAFYKAPTTNYWSTTLNGAINDSVDTITLTTATGLQSSGVVVINREDGNGTATPGAREIVHYTGISSNDLTGCTRGEEGETARAHVDGSLVEAVFTVEMWNDLREAVDVALSTDGTDLAISGTASIAALSLDTFLTSPRLAITSVASIARAEIGVLENTQMAVTSVASISQLWVDAVKHNTTVDADGATVTMNFDTTNTHEVVLGGNRTIAFSNFDAESYGVVRLIQDGTGSRTVTWTPAAAPATVYWDNGTAPTLTTTANKRDVFGFYRANASVYEGYIVGQNI